MNTICRWALIANPARTVDARVFLRKLVALYGARSQLDTASYYSSLGLGLGFPRHRQGKVRPKPAMLEKSNRHLKLAH